MCGIVGALSPSGAIDRALVEGLNRSQIHRGPDDQVVVDLGSALLGNTRLAIQDPTPDGNQPFVDGDGRFTVVFNGEIYNFRELVREHRLEPRTHCDGEVIPLLWARHGPSCLQFLRGMFGLAVFDHDDQRLFLARDPFGIKPLWWRRFADGVLFASEVKPLWRLDESLPIAAPAIGEYLQYGAMAPDRSPFTGIEAVAPGACVSFGLDCRPRFELAVPALGNPVATGAAERTVARAPLAAALEESVRLHLLADVPTALLLSAGMDSSFLAFAAAQAGQSLHCLTVTGPTGADESEQAQATACEFGHTHERVPAVIDGSAVTHFFESMQRPTIDGLNSFLVSRAVSGAGFKVALSGLGGDEALGGYDYAGYLRALPLLRVLDQLPENVLRPVWRRLRPRLPGAGSASGKLDRLIARTGPRDPASFVRLQRELFSVEQVVLLGAHAPPPPRVPQEGGGFRSMAASELQLYMQPMLLPDADAFSMAVSVELRVPFVDRGFFAAALARRHLRGKAELVDQLDNPYLRALSRRPKSGFSMPMREWLRDGVLQDVVADAKRPDAPIWDHVDRRAGLAILDSAPQAERWSEPWSLAALDCWLRHR